MGISRALGLAVAIALTFGAGPLRAQTLVILGDSLSAGYGLSYQQSWTSLLEERLQKENTGVKIVNASISGATTSAGLQRLPKLLQEHEPRWLLLELGANDGLQGKPLPLIRANLEQLVDSAEAAGAEVVLFGMQLPPNLGRRYTAPFTQMFEQLAKERELAYVPFLLEGVAGNSDLMQPDGLHPNARASEQIFNNVWTVLSPEIDAKKRDEE